MFDLTNPAVIFALVIIVAVVVLASVFILRPFVYEWQEKREPEPEHKRIQRVAHEKATARARELGVEHPKTATTAEIIEAIAIFNRRLARERKRELENEESKAS